VANPFDASRSSQAGGRLLGRRRAEATAAVEALFASAPCITDRSQAEVAAACKSAGIESSRQLRKEFKVLYGRYLDFCFEDRMLSPEETADLEHLQQILQLSDADVSSVQDDVAIAVFGAAVAEVLADLRIDEQETEFLKRLREELRLPLSKADRILEEGTRDARARALHQASAGDTTFVKLRKPAGEFTGRSTSDLHAAVNDALGKAALAIPQLHWFEVTQMSGYVRDGATSQWYVVLQAGIEHAD
jgi:flavin-binding protein dodecin